MRRDSRAPLDVFINASRIGQLARSSAGVLSFSYADDWLSMTGAGPVSLSMPTSKRVWSGDPVLFVFENLLPDNPQIRERIAARRNAVGSDAFSLLSAVGRDCVGALQFLPEGERPDPLASISGREVSDGEIAALLRDLGSAPLGMGDDDEFRISIAGAQEKTSLLLRDGKWLIPHGTTPTTHILKTPMPLRSDGVDLRLSCENEHFCMTFLRALGLPAAETSLMSFEDRKAIVIKRFDRFQREDGVLFRLHQEDICQALSVPSSMKYQKDGGPGVIRIMDLLAASAENEADRETFMSGVLVNWLLAASDGHAKNFSVFLSRTGAFRMTPLYDVMSLQPVFDAGQLPERRLRVAMSIGRRNHYGVPEITPRHFAETAELCRFPERSLRGLLDRVMDTSEAALDEAANAMPEQFPDHLITSICEGFRARQNLLRRTLRGDPEPDF